MPRACDPRSYPILTLNTDFLDDDEMQLSVFLHEQAHLFVYEAPARDEAIEELRRMYPDPPRADDGVYAWYNRRVLEDADEIGAVAARHAIVINPENGLAVEARD